jgi:hypothetical protein
MAASVVKLLSDWQVDSYARVLGRDSAGLTKPQLLQVIARLKNKLREANATVDAINCCDREGCDGEAFVRRCKEHAGEPAPHVCDGYDCDEPATKHFCEAHAVPECDCGEPSTVHECVKCHKPRCVACEERIDIENEGVWCEKCSNADREVLDELVDVLEQPARNEDELRWKAEDVERILERVGAA